jgi:hypothetical protein
VAANCLGGRLRHEGYADLLSQMSRDWLRA